MTGVHDAAARGFAAAGDAYERGRPTYPPAAVAEVVAALGAGPGTTVCDVAAGTGKLTRLLAGTGARLVAVEPVGGMRAVLAAAVPGARVVAATAEALPFAAETLDGVTVAQAFHWFDAPAALAEIARVLRPGAALALVWNVRDEAEPWVARLSEVMHAHRGDVPYYSGDEDWPARIAAAPAYGAVARRSFRHEHVLDTATLVDRVLSTSYLAALPAAGRAEVAAQVRALAAGLGEPFALPYRTDVFWCRRS